MADGDAGSNLVSGEGTNALTFTLPAQPRYKVESVVATVDNGAGGDTGSVLVMADTNGAVIAKKRQGQSVDAGATTTATWALRLTDETTAAPAAASDLLFDYTLVGSKTSIDTMDDGNMAGPLSSEYAALHFTALTRTDDAGVGVGENLRVIVNNDATNSHYTYMIQEWQKVAIGMTGGSVQNNRWTVRTFGASGTANYFASAEGTLLGYAEAVTRFRNVQILAGDIDPAGGTGDGFIDTLIGVWKSTAVIDRLALTTGSSLINFVAGSRLSVYGWGKL